MAKDATNVKIGVCKVTYDNTELGHTQGGATVSYEPDWHEVTVDIYGETPIDVSMVSERLSVTVTLAESTISNLAEVIPMGSLAGATDERIEIGSQAGSKQKSASAKELTLHPEANSASDYSDDVVFYKAIVTSTVELNYEIDNERVYEVEFLALVDENKSDGNYLGLLGDSTA